MSWSEKQEVKKGSIGETIVQAALEKRGFMLAQFITKGPHQFDFLAVRGAEIFRIAEVKTKARLNFYRATGINVRHYKKYIDIQKNQNIDVIIFFVDEHPAEERIYYQRLDELMKVRIHTEKRGTKTYPNFEIKKGIVFFHLDNMIELCKLDAIQLAAIRGLSLSKYRYKDFGL